MKNIYGYGQKNAKTRIRGIIFRGQIKKRFHISFFFVVSDKSVLTWKHFSTKRTRGSAFVKWANNLLEKIRAKACSRKHFFVKSFYISALLTDTRKKSNYVEVFFDLSPENDVT